MMAKEMFLSKKVPNIVYILCYKTQLPQFSTVHTILVIENQLIFTTNYKFVRLDRILVISSVF